MIKYLFFVFIGTIFFYSCSTNKYTQAIGVYTSGLSDTISISYVIKNDTIQLEKCANNSFIRVPTKSLNYNYYLKLKSINFFIGKIDKYTKNIYIYINKEAVDTCYLVNKIYHDAIETIYISNKECSCFHSIEISNIIKLDDNEPHLIIRKSNPLVQRRFHLRWS
jgi:hypothetical protein